MQRQGMQGQSADSARLVTRCAAYAVAADGSVGCDYPIQAQIRQQRGHVLHLCCLQVRRNLHEQRKMMFP